MLLMGDVGESDYLENLGVNGRMILKLALKKWDMRAWTAKNIFF
jgi:hypothetical protein